MKRAAQRIVVEGTAQQCFDALLEYEAFPDWQRAVKGTEVLSRHKDGKAKEVEFEIDAKVKTIRYRLRYSYEPPHRITWEYLGGDVKDVDGEFVLEDRGDGTTLATYALRLDPGVWMPGRLADLLNDQVMQGVMEDLKHRVEGDSA